MRRLGIILTTLLPLFAGPATVFDGWAHYSAFVGPGKGADGILPRSWAEVSIYAALRPQIMVD